jgi:CRISPR-associated protein Cas4
MLIPVTYLSSYLYCPRKLYIERVLKVFEPPKESLVLGKISHEARDSVNKSEQDIVASISKLMPFNEVLHRFKRRHAKVLRDSIVRNRQALKSFDLHPSMVFKDFWPALFDETQLRAQNVYEFMSRTKLVGAQLWEKLSPKYRLEFAVSSEKLGLKGVIDKIVIYTSHFVPIEMKSGKAPKDGIWPGHKLQLAAYMMMLEERMKKPVTKGIMQYGLDEKEVYMNPFLQQDVIETTAKVVTLLQQKSPPPVCHNANKCSICGLKNVCQTQEMAKTKSLNSTALTE